MPEITTTYDNGTEIIIHDPHDRLPKEGETPTEHSEPPPSISTQQTQKPQETQESQQTERTGSAWPSISAIPSLGSDLDPLGKLGKTPSSAFEEIQELVDRHRKK